MSEETKPWALLNRSQRAVLALLCDRHRMSGLEMVRESGGLLRRGTVYVHIDQMTEMGLVEQCGTVPVLGSNIRRIYQLTPKGVRVARHVLEGVAS